MHIPPGKKVYFLSDFHLGLPDHGTSLAREKKIVRFLNMASADAAMIFIVGDLFDFWYEYRKVVPKGFVRILGKMAEISDAGIPIHFFVGNHDMWMNGYFEQEMNIPVFHEPQSYEFNSKKFLVGHGDGLGPGDHGYKFLKKIFRNPVCQTLFGILPPVIGMSIARSSSVKSRAATGVKDDRFLGEENEWLIQYSKEVLKTDFYDYFIFGHRHLPIDFQVTEKSRYVNLGDWIQYDSYAVFDGQLLELKYYKE
ncbi:UDP-2,3-diacylglucosamine diphosphatase [Pollutibacter soli]|uniref:UDP-2,3-diacylglucosamine diphosphatase n=1 Tax=Pollutibacter soli TaxID=3034157 RepID=UPI0030137677